MRRLEDAADLNALIDVFQQPIGGYVWRLVGDVDLAQRIVAETFVQAHRVALASRARHAQRTWLYRTATRLAIADVGESRPGPAAELTQNALKRLPLTERVVLLLADAEGLTRSEVAEILGEDLQTIRRRLEGARDHFAQLYVHEHMLQTTRVQPRLTRGR